VLDRTGLKSVRGEDGPRERTQDLISRPVSMAVLSGELCNEEAHGLAVRDSGYTCSSDNCSGVDGWRRCGSAAAEVAYTGHVRKSHSRAGTLTTPARATDTARSLANTCVE